MESSVPFYPIAVKYGRAGGLKRFSGEDEPVDYFAFLLCTIFTVITLQVVPGVKIVERIVL